MEAQLPETEAAVTEIRVDTEAIRVVPWQEVLKQEMSDRLNDGLFLLIGMGLLTGGVVIYRRTVSGKRNIKGMPRK